MRPAAGGARVGAARRARADPAQPAAVAAARAGGAVSPGAVRAGLMTPWRTYACQPRGAPSPLPQTRQLCGARGAWWVGPRRLGAPAAAPLRRRRARVPRQPGRRLCGARPGGPQRGQRAPGRVPRARRAAHVWPAAAAGGAAAAGARAARVVWAWSRLRRGPPAAVPELHLPLAPFHHARPAPAMLRRRGAGGGLSHVRRRRARLPSAGAACEQRGAASCAGSGNTRPGTCLGTAAPPCALPSLKAPPWLSPRRPPTHGHRRAQGGTAQAGFCAAGAREALLQLLARQEWLAAIEAPPLRSVAALRSLPVDGGRPGGAGGALDAELEAEAHAAAAERLLRAATACW
jgi:hypothetical protein